MEKTSRKTMQRLPRIKNLYLYSSLLLLLTTARKNSTNLPSQTCFRMERGRLFPKIERHRNLSPCHQRLRGAGGEVRDGFYTSSHQE